MQEDKPMVIAHCGASSIAPENTLAAIRKAIELGADGIELDVRRTQDLHLVLMHDATVDRTTDGYGRVCELPFSRVGSFDAGIRKGAQFSGERVPLLRNALGMLKGKAAPVIEIKDEGISHRVVSEIEEMDMVGEATILCFNPNTIREIRGLDPNPAAGRIRTALLIGETAESSARELIERTRSAGADHPDMHWSLATPECVAAVHAEGMPVWVWTVNDGEMMKRLMDIGVDGITTDDLETLRQVITGVKRKELAET